MNINRAKLSQYLGLEEYDPQAEILADYALDFLSKETHCYFGPPADFDYYAQGSDTDTLWLPDAPIPNAPLIVTEYWYNEVENVITDFVVRGRSLRRFSAKTWGKRYEYRVEFRAGFNVLPLDVEQAVFDLVKWKIGWLETSEPGMMSEKIGDYSYTRGTVDGSGATWLPRLNATIMRYQRNPL